VKRWPGIDLAVRLCEEAGKAGHSIFLLGAAPGVADAAADFLRSRLPQIRVAGTHDGYFDPADEPYLLRRLSDAGARLVLVAFGSPRQEAWVHRHRRSLPPGLYVGVGGSFDVWSGSLQRAPVFVRRWGLEWLFRLVQQPARIRRMIRLPVFAWRVFVASRTNSAS
jgi:N-acetylglucosaminyldiphosphoundecaprenol N-acetyl-beta-D-mannosaminyltransferase